MVTEIRELIIPAFSNESFQVARQRANDCHNQGVFAFLAVALQYISVNDFIEKAHIADAKFLARAPCQGILLDLVVGTMDFFENTINVFLHIVRESTPPCFLVRYSHPTKYVTIIARNMHELERIKKQYWDVHGREQSMIQILCPVPDVDEALRVELNKNSNVVICADANMKFDYSWADSIYKKFDNVTVVF